MDSKFIDELKQKYIKDPPEGMTAELVKNMTDSDLLDIHYFLTEDDDLDDDEFEEGFLYLLKAFVLSACPPPAGYFIQDSSERRNFLLNEKQLYFKKLCALSNGFLVGKETICSYDIK